MARFYQKLRHTRKIVKNFGYKLSLAEKILLYWCTAYLWGEPFLMTLFTVCALTNVNLQIMAYR